MSGERPCVRQSDLFRSQMSGSAIGGMLHWNGAAGGATEIIRANKPRQAPPAYRQLQAPLEPLASHAWRDGERGHIGDTYSKGSFNATDYKHGKKIQHHTRGPTNHSAWRGGEKGRVADALNADAQPQPQQQTTAGVPNSIDDAEPYKPVASHTWRDGERGHIGDIYTKGGFKGTDYKHGKKIQHHTRAPINNSTWRSGERGVHMSDVFKVEAQLQPQKRSQQQQRSPQQQRQQLSPRRRGSVGRGPPTSPVQVKTKCTDTNENTNEKSPIGKVWEDTDYWEQRKKKREAKKKRPITHPRRKPKARAKKESPNMPALKVDKALEHQSSPKYPSIRLGSRRESIEGEWDSELSKVIKLHSKDEKLRATGKAKVKSTKAHSKAKSPAKSTAKSSANSRQIWRRRSGALRKTGQQLLGREEQRVLRGKQHRAMAKQHYRTINGNYGGNRIEVF